MSDQELIDDANDDQEFDFTQKKKKKKNPVHVSAEPDLYDYEFLLARIYKQLNPELINRPETSGPIPRGGTHSINLPPPIVGTDGPRKTVWINFNATCKKLDRKPEHVVQYALAELSTTGNLDGELHFVIKGRYRQKHIQSVLRQYVAEYVVCKTCRSFNTKLKNENRMVFLECKACGSTTSVAVIKTGFKAVVGKRKFQKVVQ